MDLSDIVPEKVFQIIAIDFGLLILAGWFFILLLIIREFREFAVKVTNNRQTDDQTLQMCQQSIDSAMAYINDNSETLNELVKVQQLLESQLSEIKSSTKDHVSPEEQALIDDLNKKLSRSHKLIRKLKGDLDTSAKRLKTTREKLYNQYDTVEQLQKEKEQIQQQYAQLEQEYEDVVKSGGTKDIEREHQLEKQNLVTALAQYKRQIDEQEQAIIQLQQQDSEPGVSDVRAIKKDLANAENKLKHMTKEKEFVEKRYLDLLKEVDKR